MPKVGIMSIIVCGLLGGGFVGMLFDEVSAWSLVAAAMYSIIFILMWCILLDMKRQHNEHKTFLEEIKQPWQ